MTMLFGDSMVAHPMGTKFIRAIAPQATTAACTALSAVIDAATLAASPDPTSKPVLLSAMEQ
jgi:hypothetical protein